MPQDLSSDDVRREQIEALGPQLGPYFHELYGEVAWIRDKWREFRELYGTSPERVEILNDAASRFFGMVHDALWEDALLHLSRLTDPARMGKRENLTLCRLPGLIAEPALRADVDSLVAVAVEKCSFARDWRNRHIAHRDQPLSLDPDALQLAHASRLSVQEALDAITAVILRIHEHYLGGMSLDIPGGPGDALDLLRVLRDGLDAERARERRFTTGNPLPEDLTSRPSF
jgi:hypothetical protein